MTSKLPFIKIQIIGSYDKLSLTGSYYLRVQSKSYCGGMYKTMLQTQPSYKGLVSENLLIMRQGERISGLEDKVKEMVSTVQKCKIWQYPDTKHPGDVGNYEKNKLSDNRERGRRWNCGKKPKKYV